MRSLAAALAELDDCFRGDDPDDPVPAAAPAAPVPVVPPVPTVPPVPPAGVAADGDAAFDPAPPPVPFARTYTCARCGLPLDWKRDGVPFLDGSCAHVACYERAEQRPEAPPASPPPSVEALAWARERASGFGFAELLKACGRTDVSTLVTELRDAGFARDGAAWREGEG